MGRKLKKKRRTPITLTNLITRTCTTCIITTIFIEPFVQTRIERFQALNVSFGCSIHNGFRMFAWKALSPNTGHPGGPFSKETLTSLSPLWANSHRNPRNPFSIACGTTSTPPSRGA
jgi:hypothetical protein